MMASGCSVYELRQYTLQPGARNAFVELFDREFVETQEAAGIRVIGQYRDLDRPDVFVWIRGFADMASRREGLEAFYYGPVWAAHRQAANSMMLDSDNVLLLEPAGTRRSLEACTVPRAPAGAKPARPASVLVACIYALTAGSTARFSDLHERVTEPLLRQSGGEPLAALRTCEAANTFPRLPVREGERLFVTVARFPDLAAHSRHASELAAKQARRGRRPAPGGPASGPAQTLRLAPTPRSALT